MFLAGPGTGQVLAQRSQQMAVMTFNIRFDNPEDGINAWPQRRSAVIDMLQKEKVSIVGVQEALVNQLQDIKQGLPGFTWFGHGRDDGKTKGELSAIFYDSTCFEWIEGKTFWLSPTPDAPGVKGWDAACPRIVTWVNLKNKETGTRLYIINTHLDHMGELARRNSAVILSRLAQELSFKGPVIMMGDFNAGPESEVIKFIEENSSLRDTYDKMEKKRTNTACTFSGFDGTSCEHIDYIWISDKIQLMDYQIIENDLGNNRLSDHKPVKVLINFK